MCGFAIFFFPDVERALSEFRRVLKPGGALVVSTLGPGDLFWEWLSLFQPGTDSDSDFDTAAKMEGHFTRAGFGDVSVQTVEETFFYTDEDEWWATLWSHGLRMVLEKIPADVLEQLHTFALDNLREMKQPDGIPMAESVLITVGK